MPSKGLSHVGATLDAIEAHPALRQTPEQFGQAVARAGRELMSEWRKNTTAPVRMPSASATSSPA